MRLQANRDSEEGIVPAEWGRFVVLRHEAADNHWDLMVEVAGEEKLWTWQVGIEPGAWGPELAAERIADHRKVYLTYEGEISGNRGRVKRVDEGRARILAMAPRVRVELEGAVVQGVFTLTK